MLFGKPVSDIVLLDLIYQYGNYMNAFVHYRVLKDEDGYSAVLKLRDKSEDESVRFPVTHDKEVEIEDMLNRYKAGKWNGFNRSDKYVLDGRSFSFQVKMADGSEVYAHGYAAFPRNFREVREELEKILEVDKWERQEG